MRSAEHDECALAPASAAPFSVQSTEAVTVSSGTAVIPISAPSFNGAITLDGAVAGGAGPSVALTVSNSIPAGFPSFPTALVAKPAARVILSSSAPAPILVIQPVFSGQVTSSHGQLQFTLPPADISAADAYYIAYFDPNNPAAGWQLGWAGPAIVSGDNLTFTSGNVIFEPHTTYALVVYAAGISAPTPTPAPSALPTPTPTPAPTPTPTPAPLQLSTSSVSINGANGTSPITVMQAGYTGTITQANTCGGTAPIATFSATSAGGPSWTLTITAASTGACAITFTGAGNRQATASITTTASGFTINSAGRR